MKVNCSKIDHGEQVRDNMYTYEGLSYECLSYSLLYPASRDGAVERDSTDGARGADDVVSRLVRCAERYVPESDRKAPTDSRHSMQTNRHQSPFSRDGKRPRDLLNPKAVKYMQFVFSTKDAISKRETREISAHFGVTVTQVRDFFTGQRSRVRKFARLSRVKSNRSSACDAMHGDITSTSDINIPVEPVPLDSVAPTNIDEGPSCSKGHEVLSGVEESDLHFIENIFGLMRKEESFSGQVKLLKWILRMENPSVLNWFLTEGGLMILATWLCEAAKEEQSSFLRVVLKLSLDNVLGRKAASEFSTFTTPLPNFLSMVEHPGQRLAVGSPQVARSTSTTQSRPLSADDIQKAKMRAQFMQSKHGKTITCPDEKVMPESQNRCTSSHAIVPPSVSKSYVQTEPEEQGKLDNAFSKLAKPQETSLDLKEPPWKKYKRIQIPWRTPPEVKISEAWCVGDGANSKEVEVQKNRIRRERETVYRTIQEIPSNPKEPWDREMDPDDTLTPEIPIEQLPDVEPLETPSVSANGTKETVAPVASTSSENNMPEPDLELLAALLKNPELVFALTSGQAGNLSSHETVKLLDMIKANGMSSLSNNVAGNAENKVEVSLPSPTPSSDPNGPRPDFSRNPFSRQHPLSNGNIYQAPGTVQPRIPATTIFAPQSSATVQHVVVPLPPSPVSILMPPSRSPTPSYPPPKQPESSYLQERLVSNSLRTRQQGFESNYHNYQNNPTVNGYNAYAGGRRNNRPEFESWSLDNSPSRRHEYLPGQYYRDPNTNLRHDGYRDERTMQQNLAGNKRWRDHRR
ncbi:hypothetical protein DH2020_007295 [Rehmannia glutinosa]|uniref:Homeobox domain-containing protein n=1 Tax=Rehmannia glutinosa TaxID=99300 RepID=A0ABR0TXP9_REHGL